mmetsp:Transcript_13214/g.41330  ORF Transcript_13214/g.41330 Transcript_13214/m.41330 type:complete len:306 (-) Transcript_13214:663-1580(-)
MRRRQRLTLLKRLAMPTAQRRSSDAPLPSLSTSRLAARCGAYTTTTSSKSGATATTLSSCTDHTTDPRSVLTSSARCAVTATAIGGATATKSATGSVRYRPRFALKMMARSAKSMWPCSRRRARSPTRGSRTRAVMTRRSSAARAAPPHALDTKLKKPDTGRANAPTVPVAMPPTKPATPRCPAPAIGSVTSPPSPWVTPLTRSPAPSATAPPIKPKVLRTPLTRPREFRIERALRRPAASLRLPPATPPGAAMRPTLEPRLPVSAETVVVTAYSVFSTSVLLPRATLRPNSSALGLYTAAANGS